MVDKPGLRAISQTSVWAFRGRLINEMPYEELLSAMADCCEYASRLEEELARMRKFEHPAPFKYVKDKG